MMVRIVALWLFILFSLPLFAQKRVKVTGYIRDAEGNPLELVNVLVKNTLNGTMTNEKGFYSLNVATGDSVVFLYSCIGYNKAERIVPSLQADLRLNVQMNYSSIDLGEFSVTAIRKQTSTMETMQAASKAWWSLLP